MPKPDGSRKKPPHKQPGNRDRHQQRPDRGKDEIEVADIARGPQKSQPQRICKVVQADQRERQKSPEDKSVGQPRQRTLLDDLPLAEYLPEEVPHSSPNGMKRKVRIFFGAEDGAEDRPEPPEEEPCRDRNAGEQQRNFKPGEVSPARPALLRDGIRKRKPHPSNGPPPLLRIPEQPSEPIREQRLTRRSSLPLQPSAGGSGGRSAVSS